MVLMERRDGECGWYCANRLGSVGHANYIIYLNAPYLPRITTYLSTRTKTALPLALSRRIIYSSGKCIRLHFGASTEQTQILAL